MSKQMDERNALIYKIRKTEGKTLKTIAKMFGITRERVRQIHAKYAELERLGRYPQPLDSTIDN